MSTDPLTPLVDDLAGRVAARLLPAVVNAIDARHLPTLAVPVAEAARALGVSPPLVRRLVASGRLDTLDEMDGIRVTVASLHAYAGHPLLPQLHEAPDEASNATEGVAS